MTNWVISPEVAGQLGEDTKLDSSVHPPVVHDLHYEFDGWLGDELLESFPCFIIAERVAQAIRTSSLTGWSLGDVKISTSEGFDDLYPNRPLPEFRRLVVTGSADDDFQLTSDGRLVVSDRALDLLRRGQLDHAEICRTDGAA